MMENFPNCVAITLLGLLKKGFYRVGHTVGRFQKTTIGVSLLFCAVASSGLFRFNLNYDLRERYAPYGARSREETQIYQRFFTEHGEHWDAYVMIRPLDGGSLLRSAYLEAAYNISEYLEGDFAIGDGFGFKKFCGEYCNPNLGFRSFHNGYNIQASRIADNASFDINQIQLNYPFTQIFGTKIDMVPIFFGVEKLEDFAVEDFASTVTPITDVKIILLSYRATVQDDAIGSSLKKWELSVFEYLQHMNHPLINATIFGDNTICAEVSEAGIVVIPYFVVGFGILLVFSVLSVTASNVYQSFKRPNIIAMAMVMIAGVISPILASSASFGIIFYLMPTFDSVLVVTPFLVLAIGVDDAFLMIHAWQQVKHRESDAAERLAIVMAESGPSILITSLTNALAFAVGATTSTPALRSFCIATAIAMIIDLLLETTFFAAVLSCSAQLEKKLTGKSGESSPASGFQSRRWSLSTGIIQRQNRIVPVLTRLSSLENGPIRAIPVQSSVTVLGKALEKYCKFISNKWSSIAAFFILIVYWVIVGIGTYNMKAELSTEKLFLRSSILFNGEQARSKYIFDKYHSVTIIVKQAPNFSDPYEYQQFQNMVKEFEALPDAIGPDSTRIWVKDYETYQRKMVINYGESCGLGHNNFASYDDNPTDSSKPEIIYYDEYTDEEYGSQEKMKQIVYDTKQGEYETDEFYNDYKTEEAHSVKNLSQILSTETSSTEASTKSSAKLEESTTESSFAYGALQEDYDDAEYDSSTTKATRSRRETAGFAYNCLHFFIRDDFPHWEPYVKTENLDTEPYVSAFLFTTAYQNSTSWSKRVELMTMWRGIAEKYAEQFQTAIWHRDGLYYDQLLTVQQDTLQTVIMTFCCMAVVCFFLIPSLASCICASLSVASISIGVYGCLSWWSIDLDPFTMGSLIMSIGFSVDYTAHVSYHYFKGSHEDEMVGEGGDKKEDPVRTLRRRLSRIPEDAGPLKPAKRLQDALSAAGWPMIQAAASTLLCMVALCFVDSYMIEVFRKTVFLVVLLGMVHGLVLLPAILAALPAWLVKTGCSKKKSGAWELEEGKASSTTVLPKPSSDSGYAAPLPRSRSVSIVSLSLPPITEVHKSRLTRTFSGVPATPISLSPSKLKR